MTAANLAENSPHTSSWARSRISPNAAASQNAVEPPLPSTISYPSGSENSSARPARMRPTSARTGAWRWLVPSTLAPVAPSAATASAGTFDGPEPKRPSAGLMPSGMVMRVDVTLRILSPRVNRDVGAAR